ncbi:alpha-amylase family glycosyl hydrolase [Kiritimatiellaeota bacterium B1221]|nr:alpha-amylase family glycosyl hydrolase [Kiritimatiellaeota bacterium B1221]
MVELDLAYEAQRSLRRLRPKIVDRIQALSANSSIDDAERIEVIDQRLEAHWPTLFGLLHQLYGHHYDFFYYLENILITAVDCWLSRPDDLYALDLRRENDPGWYLSERLSGGSLYVDLFSDDLKKLKSRIPYFKELGLTYVHLMPLFAAREGQSDGGYAINDYRSVDPKLGSMDDLRELADAFRENGISLVLDFVFNHTSDQHAWAIHAQEGNREYMEYYHMYPDRHIPDQYEENLREIFPTIRRGNFSWHSGLQQWVWTTFNNFQWDLKYANPEVFRAMASEMLFLANTGVEILRLDAVAFVWKKMGTNCENLDEAHLLIQAFNAVCRIAAPGLVFKSEAIVHPDEVVKYISRKECQLSYNPTLMALLWESAATRNTSLLRQTLGHRHELVPGTVWVNYLRGHDDIGWSFDNGDAWAVGIDPHGHRDFLNRFYTGEFEGSFAAGVPFQKNEETGDMRVCGTMASLAGLEQGLKLADEVLIEMALLRIKMLYGVLCSIGGIPLIFMGEEWGVLNDYTYARDADKVDDSRWVHRPAMDWSLLNKQKNESAVRSRLHQNMKSTFELRAQTEALRGNHMKLIECENPHVLGYLRWHDANRLIVLANFSEQPQRVPLRPLRAAGFAHFLKDLFTGQSFSTAGDVDLSPYAILWLQED